MPREAWYFLHLPKKKKLHSFFLSLREIDIKFANTSIEYAHQASNLMSACREQECFGCHLHSLTQIFW